MHPDIMSETEFKSKRATFFICMFGCQGNFKNAQHSNSTMIAAHCSQLDKDREQKVITMCSLVIKTICTSLKALKNEYS